MIQKLKNAHPAISLKVAYKYAQAVGRKFQANVAFDRSSLLRAMGFSRVTGAAQNAAGSLVHFGLLQRVEGGYILPTSTREILSTKTMSDEWKSKLKPLALNPEMYKYLYDQYKFEVSQDAHKHLIDKYGNRNVNKSNIQSIINNYLESLTFAGYPVTQRLSLPFIGINNPKDELEERKEVELDGRMVTIYKKYLLEAYEKTLREDLQYVQERLKTLK